MWWQLALTRGPNLAAPAALFGEGFRQLQALNTLLPIMIAEMGSAEDAGDAGRKAARITDLFVYAQRVPDLIGFIWFDMNKKRDWRISSSGASLSVFRAGASSPEESDVQ